VNLVYLDFAFFFFFFLEDFTASIDNSNVLVYMPVYGLCLHSNAILQQN